MKFLINPVTQFEQNCSLIICEQTNQSAFVDPGGDIDKLIEVLETSNSNLSKMTSSLPFFDIKLFLYFLQ